MNAWIVWNTVDNTLEEVSSEEQFAVKCCLTCNEYYGDSRCIVFGPSEIDSGYKNITPKTEPQADYKAHMRDFGVDVPEQSERDAQRDAQIRAMGHDPAEYRKRVAQRDNQFVVKPIQPRIMRPTGNEVQDSEADYGHMSMASEVTNPEPLEPLEESEGAAIEQLIEHMRQSDPADLQIAIALVAKELMETREEMVIIPNPARLKVDMKH